MDGAEEASGESSREVVQCDYMFHEREGSRGRGFVARGKLAKWGRGMGAEGGRVCPRIRGHKPTFAGTRAGDAQAI